MINKERIVPIESMDFLSLVGSIFGINGTSYAVIRSTDGVGTFEVTGSGAAGNKLCDQPLKSLDFKSGVTSATVYFVAAYDYAGFKVAGTDVTIQAGGDQVVPDGITLHKAVLGSGNVTVTQLTPKAS